MHEAGETTEVDQEQLSPEISALRHMARQPKLFELSSPHMDNAVDLL